MKLICFKSIISFSLNLYLCILQISLFALCLLFEYAEKNYGNECKTRVILMKNKQFANVYSDYYVFAVFYDFSI